MGRAEKKKKDSGYREIAVPKDLVRAIMAAETRWFFDPLEGIIEAPTMQLDGSILDKPGYDRATGLYYDPRNMPAVPTFVDKPTADDAVAALAVLDDVLDEFAFSDDEGTTEGESKSVAIAAILAAGIRRVLPICPVFLIDAPGQSNGKTLLADLIATIWTGRGAGATQWAGNNDEQRKVITSILVAGDLVVNFDNVTAPIGGASICSATTAQANFKDRQLGSTKMLDLPTCVLWIFTGNHMVVLNDMGTRVTRISLDARCERPDLRTFRRKDLLAYVKEHRGALVHAALTILRAYIAAGKPMVSISGRAFEVSGRFNEFSYLVAAALVWLDRPDPLGSQLSVVADDPVRETRRNIMQTWCAAFGLDRWVTAKDLRHDHDDDVNYGKSRAVDEVVDAINEIEAGGKSQNAIAVKLKTFERVIIDGLKLVRRPGKPNQPTAWQLQEAVAADAVAEAIEGQPWD